MNTAVTFIFTITCAIFVHKCFASITSESRRCCDENVPVQDNWTCLDGKPIDLDCEALNHRHVITLNNEWSLYQEYREDSDSMGRFVDAYGIGYTCREPHYCIGSVIHSDNTTTDDIALVCISKAERKEVQESETRLFERIYLTSIIISNCASAIGLAVTAIIYHFLKNIQDSHSICLFHFTSFLSFLHATQFYSIVFNPYGLLPDFCLTNLYLRLFILFSSFFWCTIVGFNSWIHVKAANNLDEHKLIIRYRYFGYGIPAIMILVGNLYAHAAKLYTENKFEMDCYEHQQGGIIFIYGLPLLFLNICNVFFYFDTQRRLWRSPLHAANYQKSSIKKMKYRLMLNGRLFFTMGIPWILLLFCLVGIHLNYSPLATGLLLFSAFLVSSEGVFIFLILVAFRKRVLKSLIQYWLPKANIFPNYWKTMVDTESMEDTDLNNIQGADFERDNVGSVYPELNNGIV